MIALALLLVSLSAFAQIDPTVEVSREYKLKLSEIHKPARKGRIADSLQRFDLSYDYSILERPYRNLYEFAPYQAVRLDKADKLKAPIFAADLGAQWPFSPHADLALQIASSNKLNAEIFGSANSLFASLGNADPYNDQLKINTSRINVNTGASVKFAWDTGEFDAGVHYKLGRAADSLDAGDDNDQGLSGLSNFGITASFTSAERSAKSAYYKLDASFDNTAHIGGGLFGENTLSENVFDITGRIGSSFGEHRVYVDAQIKNSMYGDDISFGIVDFTPIYEYSKGRFNARLGVKFGNRYGADMEVETNIFPDIDAKVEVVRNALWLKAIVAGGNDVCTMRDVVGNLPWANFTEADGSMADIRFSSRPVDAKVSLETILGSRLAINLFGAYTVYYDKMQLLPEAYGKLVQLKPSYMDYNKATAGLETSWKSRDLKLFGAYQYNRYYADEDVTLYMLPSFQANMSAEFNYRKRIYFTVSADYESERESPYYNLPAYVDLGAKFVYIINRKASVYVSASNLLNQKIYHYAMIPTLPINVGGGVSFNF